MNTVRLRRVTLCGFGLYAEPTTYAFQGGLNVFVAPNEAGKSTLVAGVAATLFGLPAKADPSRFSQARYRSWHGSNEFWGEVDLEVGGDVYTVHRDFAEHRTRLVRQPKDGPAAVLFDGVHNPQGDTGQSESYLRELDRVLRITSKEVFDRTFCVTQPMPDQNEIDVAVQQLVTGSSNRRVDEVLEELFGRFKEISRETAQYGVTLPGKQPRNQRNLGELERLAEAIKSLDQRIESSRATLESLTGKQHELRGVEERVENTTRELAANEALLAAWNRWLQAREKRDEALRTQTALERALEEFQARDGEFRALQQQIEDSYPEFADAPADLTERCNALLEAERALADVRNRLEELETQRRELSGVLEACEETIERQYGAIKDKPDLLRDVDQLRAAVERQTQLRERVEELERRCREVAEARRALPPWDRLGAHPGAVVDTARERVRRLRGARREFDQAFRRAEELRGELKRDFSAFAGLSDEALAEVERYDADRQRLGARQREAGERLAQAESVLREIEGLQRDLEEQYARLLAAPDDLLPRLERACKVKEQLEDLRRGHQRVIDKLNEPLPDRRLPWMLFTGVLLVLIVGPATYLWTQSPAYTGLFSAIAFALGATGLWVFARRPQHDIALVAEQIEMERQLSEVERDQKQLLEGLGEFSEDVSPVAVGRLHAEIDQRDRLLRRIRALRDRLPPESEIEEARDGAAAAQRELDAFEMRMNPYVLHFGGTVSAGARNCQRLREELRRVETAVAEFEVEFFGLPGAKPAGIPARDLPEFWGPLAAVAGVHGVKVAHAADLLQWALSTRDEAWAEWLEQCRQLQTLSAEESRLGAERDVLLARRNGVTEPDRVEADVERLRAAVRPYDETTDRQSIEMEVIDLRAVRKQAEMARAKLEDLPDEAELAQQVQAAQARAESLRKPLEGYLRPAGGSVERARQRFEANRELRHGAANRKAQRDGILRGCNVDSPDKLREGKIAAGHAQQRFEQELDALRMQHMLIRELEQLSDPQEVARRHAALQETVASQQQELKAARERANELLRELAGLEGKQLENVAARELELGEARRRHAELEVQRDALALAFEQVNVARQVYQESYRDRLAESITAHFQRLSRNPGRTVSLTDEFVLSLSLDDGTPFVLQQLSQGARDQLYLAVRLAVTDLLADSVILPIILDDPFLNYDEERVPELRRTLETMVERQQVVILSHRRELREWGSPVVRPPAGGRPAVPAGA